MSSLSRDTPLSWHVLHSLKTHADRVALSVVSKPGAAGHRDTTQAPYTRRDVLFRDLGCHVRDGSRLGRLLRSHCVTARGVAPVVTILPASAAYTVVALTCIVRGVPFVPLDPGARTVAGCVKSGDVACVDACVLVLVWGLLGVVPSTHTTTYCVRVLQHTRSSGQRMCVWTVLRPSSLRTRRVTLVSLGI